MAGIADQLNNVVQKTHRLMDLCRSLQEENKQLRQIYEQQHLAIERLKQEQLEADEKIRVLKLAKSIDGASEKTLDIKQKINDFVREIDKCVALLKK